ncbi:MAG TPA: hypothetical protein VJA22_03725, partial [Patescibacteria group bacterium]|nr:hypothetical protein [Patescibacteria group bacterium]
EIMNMEQFSRSMLQLWILFLSVLWPVPLMFAGDKGSGGIASDIVKRNWALAIVVLVVIAVFFILLFLLVLPPDLSSGNRRKSKGHGSSFFDRFLDGLSDFFDGSGGESDGCD